MVRTPDPTQTPGPARTPGRTRDAERSDAQLDMLHSLAATLNVLTDAAEIGSSDHGRAPHDHRLPQLPGLPAPATGTRLLPIAFRGELTTEYAEETSTPSSPRSARASPARSPRPAKRCSRPTPAWCPFSVTIAGTDDDLLESMLAVPMVAGDTLVGRDRPVEPRVRHVRRGGPADASRSWRRTPPRRSRTRASSRAERGAARAAGALLQLSQSLTGRRNAGEIFQRRDRDRCRRSSGARRPRRTCATGRAPSA